MQTLVLNESQIAEIRQIIRLEALRAAAYSLASENLDENVQKFCVTVEAERDSMSAEITWFGAGDVPIGGGRL